MRILYAAANNQNAKIQLARFLTAMNGSQHRIKVAAYKKSSPKQVSIDWTLDCLLNMYQPDILTLNNDNLKIYFEQVKYYSPDLVISDLEYFTSYLAGVLGTAIWQCSSSLINYALTKREKYNMGAFKYYAHVLGRSLRDNQKIINLLDNSNGNFVYSHFGDTDTSPRLSEGFEWVRPYHQVGKSSVPCRHYLVAGLSSNNKYALHLLQHHPDSVAFIEQDVVEPYQNVLVKDIGNHEEYFCNLKNSPFFLCQGQTSFLADAFYNGKRSLIYPDHRDNEALFNSCMSQHLGLGDIISSGTDVNNSASAVNPTYNPSVKYLHERLEEL